MSTPNVIITRAVKNYLRREHLTQEELGERLGLTQTRVSARICGKTKWTTDDIGRLIDLDVLPPITAWESL